MPSFDILHRVELYLRSGTYHPDVTKRSKQVTRTASKHFVYKDGCLLRKYRGRLLRAVLSDDEVREIMTRYHDNNNHAGRERMVREIMAMYYWVGVTDVVKDWIKNCEVCKSRKVRESSPVVRYCLAYGCDASSFLYPELTFHKFPKCGELRRRWLVVAQRDEGSVRKGSLLCSRHFDPDCFILNEEGQEVLTSDAVPTIIGVSKQPSATEEPFLQPSSLEDLLTCAAATAEVCPVGLTPEHADPQLQEHQYSLRVPDPHPRETPTEFQEGRQRPSFNTYDHIARYLSHRILPLQTKKKKSSLRRMAKRFTLIDGVLMYKLRSPPVRVPRSREEVNSILQQFHDNRGHYGHGTCFKSISQHYYWGSLSRDLHHWISRCSTCVNRSKRKWLRCSITNCTNCCGPVERKLGLTFHNFPMDSPSLLSRWLKAAGRSHWYPHLWSSVCSVHFTEDCFDRTGGRVVLRPDAVPTIKTHGDDVIQGSAEVQPAAVTEDPGDQEEAFFSKYDAVELYISRRTYPPGLTYVEKNTFRRFCKKYFMKDGQLHIRLRDRVVPVLRNRQQVNEALRDYHNELNHLDVNKCLRLLNERCFWKTMRSDITQWISKCLVCRLKKKPRNYTGQKREEQQLELMPPQSGHSNAELEVETWGEDNDFSDGSEAEPETVVVQADDPGLQTQTQTQTQVQPCPSQSQSQQKIPILLHLRTPINLQPKTPIILKSAPNSTMVAQLWSPKPGQRPRTTSAKAAQTQRQSKIENAEIRIENPNEMNYQHEEQVETSCTKQQLIRIQKVEASHPEVVESTTNRQKQKQKPNAQSQATLKPHLPTHSSRGRPLKRKGFPDEEPPTKRVQGLHLEPAAVPSPKPWPVFTAESPQTPTEQQKEKRKAADSAVPRPTVRCSEARVVVQQCSQAKVKTRLALDGAEPQFAQIGEGLVVYVCFFEGATEDTTQKIADSVMGTRFFRVGRRQVSVLDLPGSVLLLPQDSLGSELGPRRTMQSRGVSEAWWGAQLFSSLVSRCRELLSERGGPAGGAVEQGLYGQRQEIELCSTEPMSHVLEF